MYEPVRACAWECVPAPAVGGGYLLSAGHVESELGLHLGVLETVPDLVSAEQYLVLARGGVAAREAEG